VLEIDVFTIALIGGLVRRKFSIGGGVLLIPLLTGVFGTSCPDAAIDTTITYSVRNLPVGLGAQAIERTRLYNAFQTIAQHINSSLDLKQI
jgi:hypothetical protein